MEEPKEIPQVDQEAIKLRKQDRLARPIADKDTGLNNFGIAKKMKKL